MTRFIEIFRLFACSGPSKILKSNCSDASDNNNKKNEQKYESFFLDSSLIFPHYFFIFMSTCVAYIFTRNLIVSEDLANVFDIFNEALSECSIVIVIEGRFPLVIATD